MEEGDAPVGTQCVFRSLLLTESFGGEAQKRMHNNSKHFIQIIGFTSHSSIK